MKAYLLTTGATFALLLGAHVLRLVAEGVQVAFQPIFALTTLAAAGLCLWALVLLRSLRQSAR
jgi:hypothetical protein